jgi:hypothetical protein
MFMKAVSFYFLRKQYFAHTQPNNDTSPYQFYLNMNFFYATGKISYAGAEIVKK